MARSVAASAAQNQNEELPLRKSRGECVRRESGLPGRSGLGEAGPDWVETTRERPRQSDDLLGLARSPRYPLLQRGPGPSVLLRTHTRTRPANPEACTTIVPLASSTKPTRSPLSSPNSAPSRHQAGAGHLRQHQGFTGRKSAFSDDHSGRPGGQSCFINLLWERHTKDRS